MTDKQTKELHVWKLRNPTLVNFKLFQIRHQFSCFSSWKIIHFSEKIICLTLCRPQLYYLIRNVSKYVNCELRQMRPCHIHTHKSHDKSLSIKYTIYMHIDDAHLIKRLIAQCLCLSTEDF